MRSRSYFHTLIAAEIASGIPSERIVLGGFSQGGAMSLFAGTTCPQKLGGIIGLSSYLLLADKIKALVPEGNPNKDTPIFMGHGDADSMVLPQWGRTSAEVLREMGYKVDLKIYP
jgi:predicted esterase